MSKFSFKPYQGDTVPIRVAVTLNNAVYNLTGCKMFFTAKLDNAQDDEDALVKLDSVSGAITYPDAPNGIAVITLTPAHTNLCPVDVPLYCDVQVVDAANQVFTVATGKIVFRDQSTRRVS